MPGGFRLTAQADSPLPAVLMLLAWKVAGRIGFGRWLLPALDPPWGGSILRSARDARRNLAIAGAAHAVNDLPGGYRIIEQMARRHGQPARSPPTSVLPIAGLSPIQHGRP